MKNAPSPYRKQSRHPVPLHNLIREDGLGLPPDIYERINEYLDKRQRSRQWNRETRRVILNARGNPEMPIAVYRPVPFIIDHFTPGDSVVLSPGYAQATSQSRPKWRVITGTVPARELFTRSDDELMRWEWRGREPFPNGGVVTSRSTRGWRR
jgi:hypothetical protein